MLVFFLMKILFYLLPHCTSEKLQLMLIYFIVTKTFKIFCVFFNKIFVQKNEKLMS